MSIIETVKNIYGRGREYLAEVYSNIQYPRGPQLAFDTPTGSFSGPELTDRVEGPPAPIFFAKNGGSLHIESNIIEIRGRRVNKEEKPPGETLVAYLTRVTGVGADHVRKVLKQSQRTRHDRRGK